MPPWQEKRAKYRMVCRTGVSLVVRHRRCVFSLQERRIKIPWNSFDSIFSNEILVITHIPQLSST